MAEDMKETTMMIKNKVEECLSGQMAENTTENGSMGNNTEKEYIIHLNKKSKEENGKKARGSDGLLMNDYFHYYINISL